MKVLTLEENGLPLFTTSPTSYREQLQDCLDSLVSENGDVVAIVERSIGRSVYHFAVFTGKAADKPKTAKSKSAPVAE